MSDPSGFQAFCSNHPTLLLQVVGRQVEAALARQAADDLRSIPLLVPSKEMRDRLRDDLAEQFGVCAGVELLLPAEFANRWLPQRLGVMQKGMDVAATRYRICAALDGMPVIAPSRTDAWDERRLSLATRLTDALVRLSQWAAADSIDCWKKGRAGRFDAAYPYLSQLWPCVTATGDPQVAQQALLAAIGTATDLPPLVLAMSTPDLSPPLLEVLAALGRRIPVQVVLSQPVPGDWSDHALSWKSGDEADAPWSNRLLAQWGIEHRHALRRLDAAGAQICSEEPLFIPPDRQHLLAHVQRDLLAGRAPTPGAVKDASLVFQHAYGQRAEAEALKHRLSSWMTADGIPPHQVCIVCPDPDAYAPMLAAVFAGSGEGPVIPVDLRTPTAGGDPAGTVAGLILEILPGRWTATQVLTLLEAAPVADAWSLEPAWFRRVRAWCDAADLRFGVDGKHREDLQLPADATATWRRGLQRLAWSAYLGAHTSCVGLRGGIAPVDGLDESDALAVERLAAILLPLLDAAGSWREPHPAAWWVGELLRLARHLRKDAQDASDALLGQRLGRWQQELAAAGATEALLKADLVAKVLADAASSAPLRTGGVAVGTFAALRGHPWAIVCCLGMDDGAFPRQAGSTDVDPLIQNPVPGMPDPRNQDRAALLDLVIAAERHLLISWTGRDPRSGEPIPPSPAVGELLEVVRVSSGCGQASQLIDAIGLGPMGSVAPGPWPSVARRDQAHARPAINGSALVPAVPLPPPAISIITLDELQRALGDPPLAYLRRLGMRLEAIEEAPADHERLVLDDTLENWMLRDELVNCLRSQGDTEPMLAHWVATGTIPGGTWGRVAVDKQLFSAKAMVAATQEIWQASRDHEGILRISLHDGTVVTGSCPRIHPQHGPVRQTPGASNPKHRQRAWLSGLLWQASGNPGAGMLLHEKGDCRILPCGDALRALTELVAWYRDCLCSPSSMAPEVVDRVAKALDLGSDVVLMEAKQAWESGTYGGSLPPCRGSAARLLWPQGAPVWTISGEAVALAAIRLGARSWSETALKQAQEAATDAAPPEAGKPSGKPSTKSRKA